MSAVVPQPARSDAPDRCGFHHPLFNRLGEIVFRPAETDGAACLIVPLGRGTAALPLKSLQAELGIEPGSPDGQMLALVAKSLDFVADLRLGDPLPEEVLDGGASWQPSAMHQQVGASRLKLHLIQQWGVGDATDWIRAEPQAVLAAAADPGIRLRLQAAYLEVAATLGLSDAAAAVRLVEDAAHELGFVEALRDRLLRRVLRLVDRVRHLSGGLTQNLSGLEMVSRVRRLGSIAVGKIGARFAELDDGVTAVLDLLRHLDTHRAMIRAHRDWLYCSLRAWEPILAAWEAAGIDWSDGTWPLLGRTYRFLAPRFMPMQEWQLTTRAKVNEGAMGTRMIW
ncbi:MAG: hypothetical protein H7Z10_05780 [Gemmatimonadaceae bacterium]|nr:hypothetical protein [Acetobacteraceae bacterium]